MDTEPVDVTCPNCRMWIEAEVPLPRERPPFGPVYEDVDICCPTCDWEFTINGDEIADDGEPEELAELTVDEEGELIVPTDEALCRDVHAVERLRREREAELGEDYFQYLDRERDDRLLQGPGTAVCPGCLQELRQAYIDAQQCPFCDLHFHIDRDEALDYDDYDEPDDYEGVESGTGCRPSRRPSRRLVVSPDGSRDCTTISAALRRADADTIVVVRPGTYAESLVIDRTTTLVGEGEGTVEVTARGGSVLQVTAGQPLIRGLTIRGLASDDGLPAVAVELSGGELIDCDISSASGACVRLRRGALVGCRVHDSPATGILGEGGVVVDCEIFGHRDEGIAVDGPLILRGCRIRDNGAAGVLLSAESTLTDCAIHHNRGAGLVLHAPSWLLWRCRIHDNGAAGVTVRTGSSGVLEDCEVFGNAGPGVAVSGGDALLWGCELRDGRDCGVCFERPGWHGLVECDLHGQAGPAVTVQEGATPRLHRCWIHDGQRDGIVIADAASAEITDCDIHDHAGENVLRGGEVQPTHIIAAR